MATTIRPATPADAAAITWAHVEGWRTTYRGIVPDAYLDGLSVQQRRIVWDHRLANPDPGYVNFVAEDEAGRVFGFADGGHNRDAETAVRYGGELLAIYLLPESRRKGAGALLFRAVAEALVANGMPSMLVWALAENPSRAFYERMGGRFVREASITIGGATLVEVAYGWDELGSPHPLIPSPRGRGGT